MAKAFHHNENPTQEGGLGKARWTGILFNKHEPPAFGAFFCRYHSLVDAAFGGLLPLARIRAAGLVPGAVFATRRRREWCAGLLPRAGGSICPGVEPLPHSAPSRGKACARCARASALYSFTG